MDKKLSTLVEIKANPELCDLSGVFDFAKLANLLNAANFAGSVLYTRGQVDVSERMAFASLATAFEDMGLKIHSNAMEEYDIRGQK